MDEVDVQDLLVLRYTFPFNKIFYDLPLPLHTTFNSLKNLPNVVKPVTSLSNFKILQSPYFQHDINAIVGSRSVILLESSVINFTFPLKGQRSSDLIVLIKGTLEFIGPLQISRSDSFLTVIVNSNATLQIHLTNDEKIQVYNRNVWDIIQETRNPVEFDISLMNYDIELTLITINNIDTNQKMRYKKYKLHKLFDGQTAAFQFESSGQMPIVLSHLTTSDLQITSFASSNSEPVASACLPLIILIFIPILSFYSQDF